MPTNLHKKLFQSEGTSKMLRPDIIPWDHYAAPEACSVVQSRQVFPADLAKGSTVEIEGLKYLPGQLMVFVNGVKLSPGIGYTEGAPDADGYCSEITLLIGALEGDAAKFVAHNGVAVEPEAVVEFRYTVAPESTSSLSYCPLAPSRLADGTSVDIDWGDGSTEVLEAGTSSTHPTHAYPTDDGTRYQITLSAKESAWAGVSSMFFGTSTTVSLNVEPYADDQTSAKVRYLVSVDDPLPTMGFTTRANMFYNNRLLESIPSGLFAKQASEITSFYNTFYRCESLASLPEDLIADCSAATNFGCVFQRCSALTSIPDNLFSDCVSATSFTDAFQYCDALTTLPEGLFSNCVSVEDFSYCFQYCGEAFSFTLDLTNVKNVTNGQSFCPDGSASNHVLLLDCESVTAATFESASNANVWSECWDDTPVGTVEERSEHAVFRHVDPMVEASTTSYTVVFTEECIVGEAGTFYVTGDEGEYTDSKGRTWLFSNTGELKERWHDDSVNAYYNDYYANIERIA